MRSLTTTGIIAALYVVLTFISAGFGLASGVIQFRLSEALCVLPLFTKTAIPGLYIGCLISNLLTGGAFWDIVFGSLATLIGAVGTYLLRRYRYVAVWCPVVSNMLIIPFVLRTVYGADDSIAFFMLTVGIGELVTCVILGLGLCKVIKKYEKMLFEGR